jgi:membrane protease YdiL (CAAX protease family)
VLKPLRSGVQRFPVTFFVILAFGWSWGMWSLLRVHPEITPHSRLWTCIYVLGLSGPMIAAFGVRAITEGAKGIRSLITQLNLPRIAASWYLAVIFLPIAAWMLAAKLGHGELHFTYPAGTVALLWLKMLFRGGPLTEEVGWRGFLLPVLLSRSRLFWASAAIIPIWGLWHLPLWFLPGVPHGDWSFPMFLLLLAPITLIFSWLYIKGHNTLLLVILFHTSINTSFHFVPMVPAWHSANTGFFLLLGFFWILAAALVMANRKLWFRQRSNGIATDRPANHDGRPLTAGGANTRSSVRILTGCCHSEGIALTQNSVNKTGLSH